MKIQIQIICLTICIGIANNYAIANPEQYVINALELAALLPKKIQSTPPITTPKSEPIEDKFNRLNKKETIENAQTHELAKTYKELKDLKTTLKKDFSDELKQALLDAKLSFDHIGITVDPDDLPKTQPVKGKIPTSVTPGKTVQPAPKPALNPKSNIPIKEPTLPKSTSMETDPLRGLKDTYIKEKNSLKNLLKTIKSQRVLILSLTQKEQTEEEDDDSPIQKQLTEAKNKLKELEENKESLDNVLKELTHKLKQHNITMLEHLQTELDIIEYENILQQRETSSGIKSEALTRLSTLSDQLKNAKTTLTETNQQKLDALGKKLLEKLQKLFPYSKNNEPAAKSKPKLKPKSSANEDEEDDW